MSEVSKPHNVPEGLDQPRAVADHRLPSGSNQHSEQLATRWMLLKAHVEEHGTHLEVIHELLERVIGLEEQLEAAQREADIQLGEKLAAQMTLKAVCDVLNLPMVSLGNGWTEATPKILARIEEIVDEAERGFRERDSWKKVAREYETALADRGAL